MRYIKNLIFCKSVLLIFNVQSLTFFWCNCIKFVPIATNLYAIATKNSYEYYNAKINLSSLQKKKNFVTVLKCIYWCNKYQKLKIFYPLDFFLISNIFIQNLLKVLYRKFCILMQLHQRFKILMQLHTK